MRPASRSTPKGETIEHTLLDYSAVFNCAPISMCVSVDEVIVASNKAANYCFGYSEGELNNRPMSAIWPAAESFQVRETVTGHRSTGSLIVGDQILKRKNGTLFWSEVKLSNATVASSIAMTWIFGESKGTEFQNKKLSAREKQVAATILAGKTNKAIAIDINLSVRTVEYYRQRLMQKLRVANRTELVLRLTRF
jgi:PAS domain S-box-containing protein